METTDWRVERDRYKTRWIGASKGKDMPPHPIDKQRFEIYLKRHKNERSNESHLKREIIKSMIN
jgi:hypothetical protein